MGSPKFSRLEHIGIAVEDADAVIALYHELLDILPYKTESVASEGVRTHFMQAGSAKLELLEAMGEESPIARHLEKRGEGLHHLAFEVDDIGAQMARVRRAGYTPLSEEPRRGADGKLIFFLHPRDTHGVLVEFCQSEPGRLPVEHVPVEGGRLAVHALGSPDHPSLVVLHGAAGSTTLELEPLVRLIEPYFHVLALDFAGHGASDVFENQRFTFELFSQNVIAVLDAFELDRAHLFGFSMGGAVALNVALNTTERVDRVAVHNTHIAWEAADVQRMVERLQVDHLEDTPAAEALAQVHGAWEELFRRTAAFVRTLPEVSGRSAMLKTLDVPVLVSATDQDTLFPLETALQLHRLLPQSRLAVLPGSSHRLRGEQLRPLAEHLRSFFLREGE